MKENSSKAKERHPKHACWLVLSLCISLWSNTAMAYGDRAAIDIELFRPRPGDSRLLNLDLARVGDHRSWVPQIFLHYSDRPLVIVCRGSCPPRQYVSLVAHRTTANLSLALSLVERVQLALSLPIVLYQYSDATIADIENSPSPSSAGIGNLRVHMKVALTPRRSIFGLGLDGEFALPTGDGNSFIGTRLPVFDARLLAHVEYKALTMALRFGGQFAEAVQVLALPSGTSLTYGLGGQARLFGDGANIAPFYLIAEIYGMAFTRFQTNTDFPMEFMIAAKSEPGNWSLMAGAGSTIISGAGTPNVRCVVGLSYSTRRRVR